MILALPIGHTYIATIFLNNCIGFHFDIMFGQQALVEMQDEAFLVANNHVRWHIHRTANVFEILVCRAWEGE
jgi:hypothetical protein